jgi:glycerol uptake facilitator-like aquaporin
MVNRRRITQEDLLVTEKLIAESYGQVRQSAAEAPSRVLGSFCTTIKKHPFAAAATAVVAGAVLFGIFKLVTSRSSNNEDQGRSRNLLQRDRSRPDLTQEMFSMIIPLAAPYITGYLQNYIGRILSGKRE